LQCRESNPGLRICSQELWLLDHRLPPLTEQKLNPVMEFVWYPMNVLPGHTNLPRELPTSPSFRGIHTAKFPNSVANLLGQFGPNSFYERPRGSVPILCVTGISRKQERVGEPLQQWDCHNKPHLQEFSHADQRRWQFITEGTACL
jgi:hypothetical protein